MRVIALLSPHSGGICGAGVGVSAVQWARIARVSGSSCCVDGLGGSPGRRGYVSLLLFVFGGKDAPPEQWADEGDTGEVDGQAPPGLCVAAGADAVQGCEYVDAERDDVQAPPPFVADVRAQPGADADGDAKVQGDDAEGHPHGAVCADEGDEDLVPAETCEGVNPDGRDVHDDEDAAEQGQKVM